jgi:hypothetical protein
MLLWVELALLPAKMLLATISCLTLPRLSLFELEAVLDVPGE